MKTADEKWLVKSYTSSLGETGDYLTEVWLEKGNKRLLASGDLAEVDDEELHEIANTLNNAQQVADEQREALRKDFRAGLDLAIEQVERYMRDRAELLARFKQEKQ